MRGRKVCSDGPFGGDRNRGLKRRTQPSSLWGPGGGEEKGCDGEGCEGEESRRGVRGKSQLSPLWGPGEGDYEGCEGEDPTVTSIGSWGREEEECKIEDSSGTSMGSWKRRGCC